MAFPSAIRQPAAAAHMDVPGPVASPVTLGEWGQAVLATDLATFMHCERVAVYAVEIARALGFDQAEIATVRLGAALHDIGKARVPAAILQKAGWLTAAEFEIVKRHPAWGLELLESVDCPMGVREMVRFHHEKYDGTGYPDRLKGDQIPLAAAIICVADVYDALTTRRCYRPALPRARALLEMHVRQGWWHPEVYAAFCRAAGRWAGRPMAFAPRRQFRGYAAALV
jgi:putative nucleotidyltransferase with HDIG domain